MPAGVVAAASLLPALLLAPHLLSRTALKPAAGIVLFTSVLALRAALVVVSAVALLLALPSTPQFGALSSWCLHAVLPYVSAHIGLNGHAIGHLAALIPASLVVAAVSSAALGGWRACRDVRRWLRSSSVGTGPGGALIVGGSRIVLATAGIRHPRVLVSAGALITLDEGELRAGLEHERGHVKRGHRFISAGAVGLLGFGRLLPGSRAAFDRLAFYLERDADEYAVRRTGDPRSLASAISKAASVPHTTPSMVGLASSDTVDRIRVLQRGGSGGVGLSVVGGLLSAVLVAATAALALLVPLVVATAPVDAGLPFGTVFGC